MSLTLEKMENLKKSLIVRDNIDKKKENMVDTIAPKLRSKNDTQRMK